jgi:glutamate decarboxylase
VCFQLEDGLGFDVFELSERLRIRGWVVPAYRMAADAQSVAVLRVVVREGLSRDMADALINDIDAAITYLQQHAAAHTASTASSGESTPTVAAPSLATTADDSARVSAPTTSTKSKKSKTPKTKAIC